MLKAIQNISLAYVGLEPTTSGLEGPRAANCANRLLEDSIKIS